MLSTNRVRGDGGRGARFGKKETRALSAEQGEIVCRMGNEKEKERHQREKANLGIFLGDELCQTDRSRG